MTDSEGPRLVTEDEFPELMELLDRYFAYERGGMAANLPFAFASERSHHHAVIVEDGRIVSHIGAIPQTLSIGADTVECWGISGVATDRRYRGNGYMTQLLEFWFDRMDDNDVPLADLSGNRQRYAHFDFELAGSEYRYTLTERSFATEPTPSDAVAVYDGADPHLETIRGIHDDEPYRVVRDRDSIRTVFGQRDLETLVWEGDADPAYVSLTRRTRSRTIEEFGGSADGLDALLSHLLAVYDLNELTVRAPPWHSLEPVFARHSRSWTGRPHRKLRIHDLPDLLEAFAPQLEERWTESGRTEEGALSLGVADDQESVQIIYGPGSVSVEPGADDSEIELERTTLNSLLFGAPERCEHLREGEPFLETVLPLRFYIWPSEHV